jgi:hypothetical protein
MPGLPTASEGLSSVLPRLCRNGIPRKRGFLITRVVSVVRIATLTEQRVMFSALRPNGDRRMTILIASVEVLIGCNLVFGQRMHLQIFLLRFFGFLGFLAEIKHQQPETQRDVNPIWSRLSARKRCTVRASESQRAYFLISEVKRAFASARFQTYSRWKAGTKSWLSLILSTI